MADLPRLTGRTALVTGANRGIGFAVAKGPAGAGARLLPGLLDRPGSRVVTVTSMVRSSARLDFADLQSERRYDACHGRAAAAGPPGSSTSRCAPSVRTRAGGALPVLRDAADPEARPGDYYGPSGLGSFKGAPQRTAFSARAQDPAVACRLWQESARLTGIAFPAPYDG
ncbi:hypothetical protein ACFWDI_22045 [Streptomyces sp. NPDC060064]|uniref:hypothetical protein n=1 Tax=Streptomyces sp. NPDC060064 TaxID=3347049 RepID=UPI00368AF8CA